MVHSLFRTEDFTQITENLYTFILLNNPNQDFDTAGKLSMLVNLCNLIYVIMITLKIANANRGVVKHWFQI